MTISITANQDSTFVVVAEFFDEDGVAVTPSSLVSWELQDNEGNQIATDTVPAASSVSIVLSGTDLAVSDSEELLNNSNNARRTIIVSTTYDSSLGSGFALKEAEYFEIEPT